MLGQKVARVSEGVVLSHKAPCVREAGARKVIRRVVFYTDYGYSVDKYRQNLFYNPSVTLRVTAPLAQGSLV